MIPHKSDVYEEPPYEQSVPENFEVMDEATSNWVVRKIVGARAYAERVEVWAAAETRRARNEEQWFLTRYGGQLEQWVRQELADRGSRSRSLKLPAGQLGFRSVPASFKTAEIAAVIGWCRQHLPEALRVHVDAQGHSAGLLRSLLGSHDFKLEVEDGVIAAEVKKHIESTGELPPGMVTVAAEERFYVR